MNFMGKKSNNLKEPWLAVVLSSFWAGIGQIYSGKLCRGIILILTEITLVCLSVWSLFSSKCDIFLTIGFILAFLAVRIWNLFDAHRSAKKINPEDFEATRKQSKDPWLALFLSQLIPGLGQIYIRKWLWGIVFIIAAGILLIVGLKYPLLYNGLWAGLSAFVCYHAYRSAQVHRQRSNRAISIIAVIILCLNLLSNYGSDAFKTYIFEAFVIPTDAMKPTLVSGDRLLVRKINKFVPNRGDVVVFKSLDDPTVFYVKRVAALSGETIEIRDKIIYINGNKAQCLAFEQIEYHSIGNYGIESKPYKVPQDHFFLLGDNSSNSEDSRFFGAIPQSNLIGRAYKLYWPLSRRGPIK